MKKYIEAEISGCNEDGFEILIAELGEAGFESFTEEPGCLKAYIPEDHFSEGILKEIGERYKAILHFEYVIRVIEPENWNEIWEKSFEPVEIENKVRVRAQFHPPKPEYPIEIIIDPKMAFGTGHHATTWLMMKLISEIVIKGKNILDYGTGTGILAILACKYGAATVTAIDNDPQCIVNSAENVSLNGCRNIQLREGTIQSISGMHFDLVLGNITRNIIVDTLPEVSKSILSGGLFIASGFYENDLNNIRIRSDENGLSFIESVSRDNWCAAVFKKK